MTNTFWQPKNKLSIWAIKNDDGDLGEHEVIERKETGMIVRNCPNFKDKTAKIHAGKVIGRKMAKDYYMCSTCGEHLK